MKKFISILLIFLSISALAEPVKYLLITLEDESFVSGEFIESYEDRWFWEPTSQETAKYLLLFTGKKFELIDIERVKNKTIFSLDDSPYAVWLQKKGIVLDDHPVENGFVLTGNEGHHKYERMYGNFAWDIGVVNEKGQSFVNDGLLLEDYYVFGRPIRSPFSGTVVGIQNDQPDNVPSPLGNGDLTGKENNYLTIRVSDILYLSLVHLKKESITVSIDEEIEKGQLLGLVGNSGISYVPHLHYTLYTYITEYDRFISVPLY